jgi:UDP-glucose 4-epimerase
MNKILIAGGAGYIGSHINKLLHSLGYQTIVLDNLTTGHKNLVHWGSFIEGDLADTVLLNQLFSHHEITAVMHFCAHSLVGESVTDPGKYYANNTGNTINLLNAMARHKVKNFIFSSTCATFGEPAYLPMDENLPQNPINPYGRTKLMIEMMLEDYENAYGIHSVALRYFNAAGADPAGEIGEDHTPETHLIPIILDVALGKRDKIMMFGDDYETRDGTCVRDYIHVNDLASAHVKALEWMVEHQQSNHFNLGNGEGFSVKEIIDVARKVTGHPIPAQLAPRRPGDPATLIGTSEKIKKTLAWEPEFADIETIISTAWNFHQLRFGKN